LFKFWASYAVDSFYQSSINFFFYNSSFFFINAFFKLNLKID